MLLGLAMPTIYRGMLFAEGRCSWSTSPFVNGSARSRAGWLGNLGEAAHPKHSQVRTTSRASGGTASLRPAPRARRIISCARRAIPGTLRPGLFLVRYSQLRTLNELYLYGNAHCTVAGIGRAR
jgi:hypothetical protein